MTLVDPATVATELPFDAVDFRIDDSTEDADGNTEWDTVLEDITARESDRILEWINQDGNETAFTESTASIETSGTGDTELPLPKRPIVSVQSLDINGSAIAADEYWIEDTHIRLKPDASVDEFPDDYRAVSVDWTYGYSGTPEPVRGGVIRLVRNTLDQIETDGLSSESLDGSYSYRPPAEIRAEVRNEVLQYRPDSYYGGAQVL